MLVPLNTFAQAVMVYGVVNDPLSQSDWLDSVLHEAGDRSARKSAQGGGVRMWGGVVAECGVNPSRVLKERPPVIIRSINALKAAPVSKVYTKPANK